MLYAIGALTMKGTQRAARRHRQPLGAGGERHGGWGLVGFALSNGSSLPVRGSRMTDHITVSHDDVNDAFRTNSGRGGGQSPRRIARRIYEFVVDLLHRACSGCSTSLGAYGTVAVAECLERAPAEVAGDGRRGRLVADHRGQGEARFE